MGPHPLSRPTIGTIETINSITGADLKKHHKKYYIPSSIVISASGLVNNEEFFEACETFFDKWETKEKKIEQNLFKGSDRGCEIKFVKDSNSQIYLQLSFLSIPRNDKRYMPLRVIRRILASGGSSRLHLKLREELGLVYSVDATVGSYAETGYFVIDLAISKDRLVTAVDETLKELSDIINNFVELDELNRVKKSFAYDLEFSKDSLYELNTRYGWGELMDATTSIEDDLKELSKVDQDAIKAVARDVFNPKNLRVVVVGPTTKKIQKDLSAVVNKYELDFKR